MAATYDPPFHSSRQNQSNYFHGRPHFSSVNVGDADSVTPGLGYQTFVVYDGVTLNTSTLAILNGGVGNPAFTLSMETPALRELLRALFTEIDFKVPGEFQDPTDCTADGVGSLRSLGGAYIFGNIRSKANIRGASFTIDNASVLCDDVVGSVTTPANAQTPIVSYTTAVNTTYTIMATVAFSRVADGSTGSYKFMFKSKNVAGVVTNSAPIASTSVVDAPLAGTNVAIGLAGAVISIDGIGLIGSSIHWGARMRIVSIAL